MKNQLKKIKNLWYAICFVLGMGLILIGILYDQNTIMNQIAGNSFNANEGEITATDNNAEIYDIYMIINELDRNGDIHLGGNKVKITSEDEDLSLSYYNALTDEEITASEENIIEVPENGIKLKTAGIKSGKTYEIKMEQKETIENHMSVFKTATISIDASQSGSISTYVKEFTQNINGKEETVTGSKEKTAIFSYENEDNTIKIRENEDLEIYYVIAGNQGLTDEELEEAEWQTYDKDKRNPVRKERNYLLQNKI